MVVHIPALILLHIDRLQRLLQQIVPRHLAAHPPHGIGRESQKRIGAGYQQEANQQIAGNFLFPIQPHVVSSHSARRVQSLPP